MKKLFPRKAAGKYVLKSPRLKSPNSVLDMRLKGWVKAAACGKANSFQVPSLANPKVMDSRLAVSQVKRFTKNTRWTKFLMPLLPILTCRILSPKLKALSNLIGSVNPRALSRAAICRVCTERFPFREEDLRFRRRVREPRPESNAVVILARDVSGSMSDEKKYISKAMCWLITKWVRRKYTNVKTVFIAHHTEASEVSEKEFFTRVSSGGTAISSAYKEAKRIIGEKYQRAFWDVYFVHCSDGENEDRDRDPALEAAEALLKFVKLFGYVEIKTTQSFIAKFKELAAAYLNFSAVSIKEKNQVARAFINMLSHINDGAEA